MEKIETGKKPQIASEARNNSNWTSTQAYILAVFCLVLGVTLGYLFRGSASPAAEAAVAPASSDSGATQASPAQLTPEQQKE
jgi:formate hydrogenlyase subunit 3/multisubunit Na+/H+ antiporter MnhD subunit